MFAFGVIYPTTKELIVTQSQIPKKRTEKLWTEKKEQENRKKGGQCYIFLVYLKIIIIKALEIS